MPARRPKRRAQPYVPLDVDRMPVYSIGFLFFWSIAASSAALTTFLQQSPFEVNSCTLDPENRPHGCPKRPDALPQ